MKRHIFFLFVLFCFNTPTAHAQEYEAEQDTLRMLFLGSSYTHANDLPGIIAQVIEANCAKFVETEMFARDGQSLSSHLKNPEVDKAIATGKWDFVVLQERTGNVLSRRREFQECVRIFSDKIKKAKAKPLLYLTPVSKSRLRLQDKINAEYRKAGRKNHVQVIPAGIIFKKAYEERPQLGLYHRNEIHPSPVGSYLIACVFYSSMLNRPVLWRPRIARSFGLPREDDGYIRELAGK